MNDLTNRLRGIYEAGDKEVHVKRVFFEEGFIPPINIEAADYIEKLEKEIRRLEVVNKSTCSDKDLLIAHSNKLYGTWSQTRCNDSGVMDLINELGEVFDSTEAESLAEIQAKAVKDAIKSIDRTIFCEGVSMDDLDIVEDVLDLYIDCLNGYANNLRRGE